jgi:hypothetical protein
VAPWHPSQLSHELRAGYHPFSFLLLTIVQPDQLAYSWLSILQESLTLPQSSPGVPPPLDLSSTPPLYHSNLSSAVHCFTNYEPRAARNASISSLILFDPNHSILSLSPASDGFAEGEGWFSLIAEDPEALLPRVTLGHSDLKLSIYGSRDSGPLSLKIAMPRPGYVQIALSLFPSLLLCPHDPSLLLPLQIFLCEPPGVKRQFLPNLVQLWNSEMELYLSTASPLQTFDSYAFDSGLSFPLSSYHLSPHPPPPPPPYDVLASVEKATPLRYFYSRCDNGCVQKGLCLQVTTHSSLCFSLFDSLSLSLSLSLAVCLSG